MNGSGPRRGRPPSRGLAVPLLFPVLLATASSLHAQAEPEEAAAPQIRSTQAERFRAMVEGDLSALDRILGEELVYTHTTGQVEDKAAFLATLESGALSYESIQPADVRIRIHGETAVVTGRADMRVRAGDRELAFGIRFIEAYVRRDDGWELVAWQSTRLPEPEGSFLDSGGVRLHYIDEGEGEPVLLIHGLAVDLRVNWLEPGIVSSLVDAGYRVVAYDGRGHGRSGKPHDVAMYGPPEIEDAIRLLDHLGISGAHVVGYSRGGLIANRLRALHPDRVRSVTLGGYAEDVTGTGPVRSLGIVAAADSLEHGSLRPIFRALQPEMPTERVEGLNEFVLGLNDNDMGAVAAAFRAGPSFPPPLESDPRANRVPALALVGELDALREQVEGMAPVMGGLEVVVVPGADHFSAFAHDEFREALLDFLARVAR